MAEPVLTVRGLAVDSATVSILRDVSFDIGAGEIVTLFGPSGAGKTTVAMAIAGIDRPGLTVSGHIGGTAVGYLPQQAAETLNPARRIGPALGELVRLRHPDATRTQRRSLVADVLRAVAFDVGGAGLERFLRRYPHQFSGGQRTRLALAQVLATEPAAIVLDEPTAGLDTLSRAELIGRLDALAATGVAILLVTHDPVVRHRLGHRVLRVHDGTVSAGEEPSPRRREPLSADPVSRGAPAVELRAVSVRLGRTMALREVDLTLFDGETLGVVGPSGAGKSTIARCLAGAVPPTGGTVLADAKPLPPLRKRTPGELAHLQYVWQEAASSFDPRRSVLDQVAATGIRLRGWTRQEARSQALDSLAELDLTGSQARRYPPGLSGGQLQRAALVRVLLARPRVLICDEVTTGLDGPLAEHVLDHIAAYRERTGASVIQIGHDVDDMLNRVDRIIALDHGRIVETLPAHEVLAGAGGPLVRALLAAGRGAA